MFAHEFPKFEIKYFHPHQWEVEQKYLDINFQISSTLLLLTIQRVSGESGLMVDHELGVYASFYNNTPGTVSVS